MGLKREAQGKFSPTGAAPIKSERLTESKLQIAVVLGSQTACCGGGHPKRLHMDAARVPAAL